jgi:hypothetical protein
MRQFAKALPSSTGSWSKRADSRWSLVRRFSDVLGLVPALRCYLDQYTLRACLRLKFFADQALERVDVDVKTACFRVAQPTTRNRTLAVGKRIEEEIRGKSITPLLSPNRLSEWWWESMAHSLKRCILGRAKGISSRFSPGASRPRGLAARHSQWCGTWIRMQRGGCKPFSGVAVETRHGFEDPVGWRRRIARSGRRLVWEEMRPSSGLVPCCATDRANRKGIPVSPLRG